ncbi:MAG: hypothetical protein KF718_31785, partial [Polyangiaceae bacterium]|nr:hypothetical protein [Polyangiaceae bacterium]
MDAGGIEALAEAAYERARQPALGAPLKLANALLGGGARHAVFDIDQLDGPAKLWEGPLGASLLIRADCSQRQAEWFGARELGRWLMRQVGMLSPTAMELDFAAACLRAPRQAVTNAIQV